MNSIQIFIQAKKDNIPSKLERAKNMVISEHYDYCKRIVYRWARNNPELSEDLHQSALMGLTVAMNRYDPEKANGGVFMTFAYRHIIEKVVECFNNDQEIKISDHKKRLIPRVVRFIKKYQKEHNLNPDFNMIAEMTDIDVSDIIDIVNIHYSKYSTISLNDDAGADDSSPVCYGDFIADVNSTNYIEYVESNINITENARSTFRKLTTNQLNVFMYVHTTESKIKDAAKVLGLTYERCRQLNKEAMEIVFKTKSNFFSEKYLNAN